MICIQVTELAEKHHLPSVPILLVGSRGDCSNYDAWFMNLWNIYEYISCVLLGAFELRPVCRDCGCYAIQIQPKVVIDVVCIKFRKLPSNCWKQKMAACVPPNLSEKVEQLRIQSTPHWCQASLRCHQLMVILRKELWWNLGIAKHLQMKDQSSRLRSRNFMKVKDQLLPLAIHPWNPIFYRRSMRIVWQQRPVKLVL